MATTRQPQPGPERSEGLLPADEDSDDGRFEVAEEISLDEQSDTARRVGHAPDSLPGGEQPPPGARG